MYDDEPFDPAGVAHSLHCATVYTHTNPSGMEEFYYLQAFKKTSYP